MYVFVTEAGKKVFQICLQQQHMFLKTYQIQLTFYCEVCVLIHVTIAFISYTFVGDTEERISQEKMFKSFVFVTRQEKVSVLHHYYYYYHYCYYYYPLDTGQNISQDKTFKSYVFVTGQEKVSDPHHTVLSCI